mmetsp:Transcript_2753/g.4717  ORF Transcript_2753/g.4717 Transcript_2753/m.4717 type:complete len:100 (-) Transcript_2753:738-1037(-)
MKDHTESLLVEFDPNVITYEDILLEWSKMDYPYSTSKVQYRSAIFCVDEDQKEVAEGIVDGIRASSNGRDVYVDIEPVTRFYKAEEYHQDFLAGRGGGL